MKTAVPVSVPLVGVVALACVVCLLVTDCAAGVAADPPPTAGPGETFFDKIFNIPRSVLRSVNKDLNERGVKCRDGQEPVKVDGKQTCHDRALDIPKSALDSVNDFLNG